MQLPHEPRRAGVVLVHVDRLGDLGLETGFLLDERFAEMVERLRRLRLVEPFAQLHLLGEKIGRHGGIGLEGDVHAVQLEEVPCALHGVLERAIGLVHPRGPLERRPPLGVAGVGEPVRMYPRLDFAVGTLQRRRVQGKRRSEAEEFEVIMHPVQRRFVRSRTCIPCIGKSRERRAICYATLNDSPQPHSSFTFGFLNLKPSFRPSRV